MIPTTSYVIFALLIVFGMGVLFIGFVMWLKRKALTMDEATAKQVHDRCHHRWSGWPGAYCLKCGMDAPEPETEPNWVCNCDDQMWDYIAEGRQGPKPTGCSSPYCILKPRPCPECGHEEMNEDCDHCTKP
jgi:hypothetical protein